MNDWIILVVDTVQGLGWLGPIVFGLTYVVTTVLLVPGSLIALIAGFLYGPVYGVAITSPASVLGATVAFMLSRTALRHRIENTIRTQPFLSKLDTLSEESGFKLIALMRLSPVFPFGPLNYSLGLTKVRLSDYVLASFLGMLPATVLYVYIGSVAYNSVMLIGGQREVLLAETALHWFGLFATAILTLLFAKIARRSLRDFSASSNKKS